jgi:hypothetical protein
MAQEESIPGPDTFDFTRYVEGKSTLPREEHIVYLNQAAGAELDRVSEEAEQLLRRRQEIQRRQKQDAEGSVRSLVDDETENLSDELDEIEQRLPLLNQQAEDLVKAIRDTALTLVFEVPTTREMGRLHKKTEKEYRKQNKQRNDADLGEYALATQLASSCVEVITSDGSVQRPPTREGFIALMSTLIPSESMRLIEAWNKMTGSQVTWSKRIDAGFPGRGPDVEGKPMGSAGAEDGQELGSSSADIVPGA